MTHYIVKGSEPTVKEVKCELVPSQTTGLYLEVGDLPIQRLTPHGTLVRCAVDPVRAADLGLELDETGRVKCVS